jgi:two-component system sensor histidine kinase ChvG
MLTSLRSIRFNVILVILAVVFSPLVFIFISALYGMIATSDIVEDVFEAAVEAKDYLENIEETKLDTPQLEEAIDNISSKHSVRLRVVDDKGNLLLEKDHHLGEGLAYLWKTAISWAFGPDEVPRLYDFDQSLGQMDKRPEVITALNKGEAFGCRYSDNRKLKVCHHVLKAISSDKLIYAQARTQRTIRALYDYRFQYLKLMLYNLALGLFLAWWMSRYIVRPVEHLRRQVLERADFALPGAGLEPLRKDEIGTLAEAFNSLLSRLSDRTKATEEFLSDLAHEFKNPVATVRACTENLEATDVLDQNKKEKIVQILGDSSKRLDALVSEFLELARAEAGLRDEERELIDLNSLVKNICNTLQQDHRYQDCNLALHESKDPLFVQGVARRLEMAFRNLLDNALSFSKNEGSVSVQIEKQANHAVISIKDDGPGISPDDLPRVFDRFFTTRGEKKGTGLGLAITRAVIEAHEGKIRVESQSAKGATFIVQLPQLKEK